MLPRVLASLALCFAPAAYAAEKVDYARDVRPILSNACFKCHGPAVQKAKLRLDTREGAMKKSAIVPGKPAESTILDRVCDWITKPECRHRRSATASSPSRSRS